MTEESSLRFRVTIHDRMTGHTQQLDCAKIIAAFSMPVPDKASDFFFSAFRGVSVDDVYRSLMILITRFAIVHELHPLEAVLKLAELVEAAEGQVTHESWVDMKNGTPVLTDAPPIQPKARS